MRGRHPLAKFVGVESYKAAGGAIRRDLFADDNGGVYLIDSALLDQLAHAKLQAQADDLRARGLGMGGCRAYHDLCRAAHLPARTARSPHAQRPRSEAHRPLAIEDAADRRGH